MHEREFGKFHSQLDLPFQETKKVFLKSIFETLERNFNLKENSKQTFVDLGSGNGQVIIYCAVNYGIKSIGIEIDQSLIKETKHSISLLRRDAIVKEKALNKIKIISGDFYNHNLKKYDYVYIYSLPTMHKYLNHVFQTVKREAILISHKYPLDSSIKFIEFKFRLEHNSQDQEIFTFFYRRI
ncbi:MAG: hypothetical protein ACFFBE_03660 [Promethearchaeota archaeon]